MAEVIVVDNRSTDGSIEYLSERFPTVRFIVNEQNEGFSKACNQGLAVAQGECILFLNPDTLLAEDSLHTCLRFFKTHPDAGALGVRMIDGSGTFLKESKRSFPSPLTALFKLFGLSLLFPRSPFFGRYHLGHLSEHTSHEVDVLAGAFMCIKKEVLDSVGSFDELFFMYGEDVDLSYRIQKAGYKNYYVADTAIIHFKGESTRRGSLNYVRLFYTAMNKFVRKHYGGTQARLFRFSIDIAIAIRAALAAVSKVLRWMGLPFIDALLILLSFWLVKEVWVHYIRPDLVLPAFASKIALPIYAVAYVTIAYYAGLYDKTYRRRRLFHSTFMATLVLFAGYAMLPEGLRFSRGILIFGSVATFIAIGSVRRILVRGGVLQEPAENTSSPYLLIAGSTKEFEEVVALLRQHNRQDAVIGRIGSVNEKDTVASFDQLKTSVVALGAKELILCAGRFSFKDIVQATIQLQSSARIRYHAAGSGSIVGSDSNSSSGEALAEEPLYHLNKPTYRRAKRLLDVLLALLGLFAFPLALLFINHRVQFFINCFHVMAGHKTWVGYWVEDNTLPHLRPRVLGSNGDSRLALQLTKESLHTIDYWYARNYEPLYDLQLFFLHYKHLGG